MKNPFLTFLKRYLTISKCLDSDEAIMPILIFFYARKSTDKKFEENLDAEIMQVILEEAREAYDEEIVIELRSDNAEEIEQNVERISQWVEQWKKDNAE
jgi:hypothetical protein